MWNPAIGAYLSVVQKRHIHPKKYIKTFDDFTKGAICILKRVSGVLNLSYWITKR